MCFVVNQNLGFLVSGKRNEEASRFKKRNRLYEKETSSFLLLEGSGDTSMP